MKKLRITSIALLMLTTFFYFGCEPQVDVPKPESSILPERFGVDIPGSLSSEYAVSSGRVSAVDTLKGNDIYNHLNLFINVGEGAAELVGEIILGIGIYHINKPMSFSFESDEDGRTKNLVVVEDPFFNGESWEFMLTVTDAMSESETDGGKGFQIFWNRYPIKGIAVLKPHNINREEHYEFRDAIFRIDYSEGGEQGYESQMIVSIAGLPVADPLDEPFSMNGMKMFAGKNGDIIDVYGNSSHPNATFLAGNAGFNWAFVASGSERLDIGVAEVGLPPSNLDEPGREKLLEYHSIKNVFTREIYEVWPNIGQESIDAFLDNTGAPGYFDKHRFVSGGDSPGEVYTDLEYRLSLLSPYNPVEISNLKIAFK
jgi:hypothetical protein